MGVYDDIKSTIRSLLLFEERLTRIQAGIERQQAALEDHERRLIRIETMIELAQARRLPPREG